MMIMVFSWTVSLNGKKRKMFWVIGKPLRSIKVIDDVQVGELIALGPSAHVSLG